MLNPQNTDCEYGTVFCDWLDITFSCLYNSPDEFVDYFLALGFSLKRSASDKTHMLECEVPRGQGVSSRGVLKIDTLDRFGILRVSLSGVCLEYLRLREKFSETLGFFSEHPHHITRLDSAIDFNVVGFERINDLRKKHPTTCQLSSRALRTKSILSRGLHDRSTGTFYVGHNSKADNTARCYDKRHQIWETTGVDIGFNVFRYEVVSRFKRDRAGATLRDVHDPSSLFYHYASPSLLRKPKGISDWVGLVDSAFSILKPESVLPAVKIKTLVSHNYVFESIYKLSQQDGGGGVDFALSVMRKEFERFALLEASRASESAHEGLV